MVDNEAILPLQADLPWPWKLYKIVILYPTIKDLIVREVIIRSALQISSADAKIEVATSF